MSIQSTQDNGNSGVSPVLSDSSNIDNNDEKPWIMPDVRTRKSNGNKIKKELRPLTSKEKAFTQHLIKHPNATQSEALDASYDTSNMVEKTKRNMASAIKNRAPVLAYLEKHSSRAQRVLTEVMTYSNEYGKTGTKEGAMYATVAERTANSILDRVHGKAKQTVDITSTSVTLSIDLGSMDSTQ